MVVEAGQNWKGFNFERQVSDFNLFLRVRILGGGSIVFVAKEKTSCLRKEGV